jgi:hypothetical protein
MQIFHKLLLRATLSWISLPRLLHWLRCRRWIGCLLPSIRSDQNRSCLENSLLEILSLAKAGKKAQLAIGIKKNGGRLEAHAWVESSNEGADERDGFKKLGAL